MTTLLPTAARATALAPAKANEIADVDALPKTDTASPIRLGFWVLIVGFGLFMLWAAFAPLDEGVAAPATVSFETRRKTIQHLQGGVVRALHAREGQQVKQGDVLVVLDDAAASATHQAIRQNYLVQRALEARLEAELTEQPTIKYHADLLGATDPLAQQHMRVQQQVFEARRSAKASEIAAAEQSIVGLQGQVAGLNRMLESRRAQSVLQSSQLSSVKALAEEGFAPRNQALQLEQAQAELRSSLADLETNVQRTQSGIAETRLRIAQRKQEYLKEVSSQLAEVRREVQGNEERLAAVRADLERTQIRAPVDGQVVGLMLAGVGGVVTPGQRLMDVVPRGESLLLDVKVPPNVIDRVKAGSEAEVRFTAFANSPQLVVHGRIVSLGGDALSEQVGNGTISYYLARVEITREGLKALGDRVMQPGMQADVLLKTGERSLLTYLLHPLTKRVAAAMTEE
jgi:membrane fusion protein, protease secretion system